MIIRKKKPFFLNNYSKIAFFSCVCAGKIVILRGFFSNVRKVNKNIINFLWSVAGADGAGNVAVFFVARVRYAG